MTDISTQLQQQVETAINEKQSLNIIGGNSKNFYGGTPRGNVLNAGQHHGVTNYEFTELVMTARAGTKLEEIEQTLAKNNQMLAFEPPYFGPDATIGGTIACNFSGPRRPYAGAARDFLLGTKIINGKAEVLQFGGEVMKNVAGYDVSRLMAGAMGTLGVLLEVSFKVLPKPASEITLQQEMSLDQAITKMNELAGKSLPLSATAYLDGNLIIRLSGASSAVKTASQQIGGELIPEANQFWLKLREQQLEFFKTSSTLWRISVPQTTTSLELSGDSIVEWGGGLRWLRSEESAEHIRQVVKAAGGHAVLFRAGKLRGDNRDADAFQTLDKNLFTLHRNLKRAFDPFNVFNPGRLYTDL